MAPSQAGPNRWDLFLDGWLVGASVSQAEANRLIKHQSELQANAKPATD